MHITRQLSLDQILIVLLYCYRCTCTSSMSQFHIPVLCPSPISQFHIPVPYPYPSLLYVSENSRRSTEVWGGFSPQTFCKSPIAPPMLTCCLITHVDKSPSRATSTINGAAFSDMLAAYFWIPTTCSRVQHNWRRSVKDTSFSRACSIIA